MSFLNNIGKSISNASQNAIQKGKEIADVAKINSLITGEEKNIISIYEQIGRRYAEEYGKIPAESPVKFLIEYLKRIKESKGKIAEYQQKLKELKGVTQCPACGAEVPNGSLFCALCGAKMVMPAVLEDVTGVRCTGCGALVQKGDKFCILCGKPVEIAKEENTESEEENG